jgi:two-component system cell cycle sensor histidine kinase/response regulator CckA
MVARLIGEDLALSVLPGEDVPLVYADESQVTHALVNLVVNARDAMPRGGTLTLRTGRVPAEAAGTLCGRPYAGEHAMISVADTGEGIPPELQAKIFDPFFTTKAAGKGTGLGLSTVYGTMQQAGGCVSVSSEPGRGAEFQLIFPPAPSRLPAQRMPTPFPDRRTAPARVLLVEDNTAVRFLAARVLARAGFAVQQAAEGEAALAMLQDDRSVPDLVVTDVVMPGIGIAEFIARLRGSRPGVRLLLMSGYTDEEVVRRGVEQQDYPFIHKPFKSSELVRAVHAALDGT